MKYSGHKKLLCELSKFNAFNLLYSCLQIPPRENWFQYVRRVYATAINFPCIITLVKLLYNALIPDCVRYCFFLFIIENIYGHEIFFQILILKSLIQGEWCENEINLKVKNKKNNFFKTAKIN